MRNYEIMTLAFVIQNQDVRLETKLETAKKKGSLVIFNAGYSTGLFIFFVWLDNQNGDVCKDCTQIFELLSDLLLNADFQVGSQSSKHVPANSCWFTDNIINA